MKRIALISLLMLVLFSSMSYALDVGGVWGKVSGAVTDQVLYLIVAGLMTLAGFFWKRAHDYKVSAKEGLDVGLAVFKATRVDSPGGRSITGDEFDYILGQSGEFGKAILAAAAKK